MYIYIPGIPGRYGTPEVYLLVYTDSREESITIVTRPEGKPTVYQYTYVPGLPAAGIYIPGAGMVYQVYQYIPDISCTVVSYYYAMMCNYSV